MERMRKLKVKHKHLHLLLQRLLQTDVENPLSTGKFGFLTILLKQMCHCAFSALTLLVGRQEGHPV